MLRTTLLSVLAFSTLATTLATAGCAGKSSSTGSSGAASADALDLAAGGLNLASTEAPAFGDPNVQTIPTLDATAADAQDPTTAVVADPSAQSFHVLLAWGHIPAPHDSDATDPAPKAEDWTGSLSVDAGAIGLRRTIAFDAADHIEPRTDPKSLSFDSHTLPYVDGLLVRVAIPAGGSTLLHFKTAALTTDIDLSTLAQKVGGVSRLSDDVEGLAYVGYADSPNCAKGFVHGRWVKAEPGFGYLRGVVGSGDGEVLGHVRGIWGHAERRNEDLFFAKYIAVSGQSRGLTAGKYDAGIFSGVWAAKAETDVDVGKLEGFYSDGYDHGDGRGVWLGRWSDACKP